MGYGLLLRVTHTGKSGDSVHVSDIRDGMDVLGGAFGFRKAGPVYIPHPSKGGVALLVYAGDVAVSFETGGLRQFIQGGYLTAVFEAGSAFTTLLPAILDEGTLLTPTPSSINFVGAGVTATNVGNAVTVTIPGGGGGGDHAALTNLPWLLSGHTGAANTVAAFDGLGATTTLSTTVSGDVSGTFPGPLTVTDLTITGEQQGSVLYFNGTNWVQLTPGTSGQVLTTAGIGGNPSWTTPTTGVTSHSALTAPSLVWTASGHTGTANRFAVFDAGGNTAYMTTTAGGDLTGTYPNPTVTDLTISGEQQGSILYFNGSNWVQLPPSTAGRVLTTNGVGANPSWSANGTGDVSGPGFSTDNALVRWDGPTGTVVQNSNVLLTDAGNMTFASNTTLSVDNIAESTASNGVVVNTIRNYGKSATNPSSPTPADGDIYYNTALRMQMVYDGLRSKWLSSESCEFHFGRDGATAAAQFYRAADGRVMSATLGWLAVRSGTVISLGYTRSDSDLATFDIVANGSSIATVASSATSGRDVSLNADFTFNQILAVQNQAGGNTTSDVIAYIRVKWRV